MDTTDPRTPGGTYRDHPAGQGDLLERTGRTERRRPGSAATAVEQSVVRGPDRALAVAEAMVRLADTLVTGFDVIDLFHELTDDCVRLLDVDAAGLVLADGRGDLSVVSSSSEAAYVVEVFQLQTEQGPCVDCFRSGEQVLVGDLGPGRPGSTRWPAFAEQARNAGFCAVHALPLRLRDRTIGAMNLFGVETRDLDARDVRVGQALADVATIAVLQHRSVRERDQLNDQLQAALDSRVVIEQAKGILAERGGLDLDEAFARMRAHARRSNQRLAGVAAGVTEGTVDTAALLRSRPG